MHFVLAVPPPKDLDAAARALAALVGGVAIDQRQTLLKGVPLVPLWTEDQREAMAAAAGLNAATLESWALHERALEVVPEPFVCEAFKFEGSSLVGTARQGQVRIELADVMLILRVRVEHEVAKTAEVTKKASQLKALATGIPQRDKVTTERRIQRQSDQFTLVFTHESALRLDCDELDYSGLGERMQAGSLANYLRFLELLQMTAPRATIDQRLERVSGRLPLMPADQRRMSTRARDRSTVVRESSLEYDNESAVMRAARLLYLAERRRRITA